jgi:hypothetical protein
MKKWIHVAVSFVLFMTLFVLAGLINRVAAKAPPLETATAGSQEVNPAHLQLTETPVYSVYLPLVLGPPPLNPKKGFGAQAQPACADLKLVRGSWYFNWGPWPDGTCEAGDLAKFVPRIYNAASMASLAVALDNARASGWLIGFSEPNLPWQGNLSPKDGAILWRQIEQAAIPAGIKLVSPSPNQWHPGQNGLPYGHQWTWKMVDEYRARFGANPHFDALGWNIYGSKASTMIAFLTDRRNEALARGYDVPFWLLEVGGECVNGPFTANQATMTAIVPWLNNTPWIGRYAWFANRISVPDSDGVINRYCSLIDPPSGVPTILGVNYWFY